MKTPPPHSNRFFKFVVASLSLLALGSAILHSTNVVRSFAPMPVSATQFKTKLLAKVAHLLFCSPCSPHEVHNAFPQYRFSFAWAFPFSHAPSIPYSVHLSSSVVLFKWFRRIVSDLWQPWAMSLPCDNISKYFHPLGSL